MMKSKRDNMKSPHRKNNLTISRPLSRLNKNTLVSSGTTSSSANVKVVVRVRPPNIKELGDNQKMCIKVIDENVLIFDPKEETEPFFYHGVQQKTRDLLKKTQKDMQFVFTKVFDWNTRNTEIYEESTKPLINTLMDGINCSVFAYGATGAGKTHTMLGNLTNPGITFLTMEQLFSAKDELSSERNFQMGITYLEVYNEIVQDLLNPGAILTLREDNKFGVIVAGIKYVEIESSTELFNLLEQGNRNRTQHPTDANAESSRSHAVFQVYMKMTIKTSGEVRIAKLSMIDLAGSERGSATGFQGARFAEGANINKSLLALGNCINSLADCHRHVPYRDSKLTRLLKDSLGGNCQTVMIANISPTCHSYEDTYNTLKYATRAKAIKASIKRNVVNVELKVEQYAKIVEELNKELAKEKAENKKLREERTKDVVEHIDPNVLKLVEDYGNQRKNIIDKIYAMEISEQIVQLRSEIKEDANNRLSGLCYDTPDKEERHRKLDNTIYRCGKQKEALREEIDALREEKITLETKTNELLAHDPSLKILVEKQLKLAKLEEQYKNQLNQKQIKIYQEEMQSRGDLIEKMSSVLKPCFLQLKGMGYVTDDLINNYESIISQSQGVKSIKWIDQATKPDSGMCSSTTSLSDDVNIAFSTPANKLHNATFMCPLKTPPPLELLPVGDVTFNVKSPRKKTPMATIKSKVYADQLQVKAYKPSPLKKIRLNSTNLKLKENISAVKPITKRPPQSHTKKFQLKKEQTSTLKSSSDHYISSRPIFRN